MASSGKKGKKTKGKTLALTDFLQETPGATPTIPIRKANLNWADEVEDNCDQYESRPKANVVLPTAPKASRCFDEYSEKIPQQPPYIAYLSNLPYDVNEEEIAEFFMELKISNMRIPKDDRPGESSRVKGFGYVEFEDRESLVGALSITDCTLKSRRIRIEVATNLDNDKKRGGRMDNNRDRSDRAETSGDWRSGPRAEPSEPERSSRGGGGGGGGGGFSRDRDRDRDGGGFERDRGSWRDNTDRPSFRDSDRDNRSFNRDSDRGGGFREGFGDRNRFNDRDGEKRNFTSRRNDRDDREMTRGGGREDLGSERSEPRSRPKLVLAPRSKPVDANAVIEPEKEAVREPMPTSVPASSSSIFGSAKPVDTSIRERQIEDRLAKEQEKPPVDSSRENRRDADRRDWGKRDDDDTNLKWPKSKRRDSSPRRHSPRRSSPEFKRDYSPDHSRDSYNRGSDDTRGSPDRSGSPPDYGRASPDRGRESLDRRRGSADYKRASPEPRRGSPIRRDSPERQDRYRAPTNRTSVPPRKTDDRDRRPPKSDRPPLKNDKEKPKREEKIARDVQDKEMPKLKEPEAPNFAASNKYAFLKAEDDSD